MLTLWSYILFLQKISLIQRQNIWEVKYIIYYNIVEIKIFCVYVFLPLDSNLCHDGITIYFTTSANNKNHLSFQNLIYNHKNIYKPVIVTKRY